jgi:hypothetical protein
VLWEDSDIGQFTGKCLMLDWTEPSTVGSDLRWAALLLDALLLCPGGFSLMEAVNLLVHRRQINHIKIGRIDFKYWSTHG